MREAINLKNISKCYQIYEKPVDRLKQSLWRHRKRFHREFWALRDVSLSISAGKTIGIIGSNGSGKSTLLQIICGILRPTGGQIQVNGRVAALLELGAGFNPEFTGRENVYMNASIMGLSKRETDNRFDDISSFADIGDFINQPVKTYSSGMYIRLAFAVAVHVSPDILIVDEALAVGDARFQQKCMAKIRKFCETGTVILVSHDTVAVTELCHRTLWIEGGRVVMDGSPKQVVEKYLQFMYEGRLDSPGVLPSQADEGAHKEDTEDYAPLDLSFRQFGDRRAIIQGVKFVSGESVNCLAYAGRPCKISVIVSVCELVSRPIIGFILKDRLGREILGDNTAWLKSPIGPLKPGQKIVVTFTIEAWPNLREEDYSLCVAIADGKLEDHSQCHYVYDVIIIRSLSVRMPGAIFSVIDTHVDIRDVL